jgi:hypothetical protein
MRHYEIEDGLTQIFRITDIAAAKATNGEPIKLLDWASAYARQADADFNTYQ